MKNRRSYLFLLIILAVILITYTTNTTLSKYRSKVDTNYDDAVVAKWKLKVNDEDVTKSTTLANKVKINFFENQYVAANQVAPGSEGYFDLNIDSTENEVGITYTIKIDQSQIADLAGFELVGYQKDDGIDENLTAIPETGYSKITNGVINGTSLIINNRGQETKYRIFVKWVSADEYDDEQVLAGIGAGSFELPIKVDIEQYIEE